MLEALTLGVTTAAAAIAFGSAFAALGAARQQNQIAEGSKSLQAVVEIFREHRDAQQVSARHWIRDELRDRLGGASLSTDGFRSLTELEKERILRVAFFYDDIGVMVARRIIELDLVSGYLGTSVLEIWNIVGQAVQSQSPERETVIHFENLVTLLNQETPEQARRKSALWVLNRA